MLVVLGLLSALVVGAVVALVLGLPIGIATAALLFLAGIVAQISRGGPRRAIGTVLLLALLAVGSYGGVLVVGVLGTINNTEGPADAADAAQLAGAESKIDAIAQGSSFRLELTEPELQAVIQDGVATSADIPIRRIDVDLRGTTKDLAFTATFKSGRDVHATGSATVAAVNGGIEVDLGPLDFGSLHVPGVASGAIESLLSSVTDLNSALAEQQASVQSVDITDDLLVVVGTRVTTDVLTSGQLLDSIRQQASVAVEAVQAPPERVPPGTVNATDAPGEPIVLALGDSLAANIGVTDLREGYVSRFHRAVSEADGASYGMLGLGVSGETSGTMISGGQLDRAEDALAARDAAYVTIDIGANDMLGHLDSPDCSGDLAAAACQQRIDQSLAAYRENLVVVLDRVGGAAGEATIIFLQAYNPFSLGLGQSEQERQSSEILSRLNSIAAEEAGARDILVADGFTPMQGTTAATTHMLDPEPDIHPNASGYAVLAAALVDVL